MRFNAFSNYASNNVSVHSTNIIEKVKQYKLLCKEIIYILFKIIFFIMAFVLLTQFPLLLHTSHISMNILQSKCIQYINSILHQFNIVCIAMSTNVDNVNVSEISAMSMLKTRYRFNIADVANIDDLIFKKIYVGPIS